MTQKKRRKSRRRMLSPMARPVPVPSSEARLLRAARIAFAVGVSCLAFAVAARLRLFGLPPWRDAALIFRVAGIGLMIAGWIFGRAARR